MGEPLLYEGMDDFCNLAKKYALKINLTTNVSFPRKSIDKWVKAVVPSTKVANIRAKSGVYLRVYECPYGNGWHLTSH